MDLKGLGVAVVTPFNNYGEVDYDKIPLIINSIISGGADYIVVLGTTAETSSLTVKEKQKIISYIVEVNNNRLSLVIGIGGNNTVDVIKEIKTLDTSSFKAILSVCPYYVRPSQEGIFQHYLSIAQNSSLPIIVYNVPFRTSSSIEKETLIRLSKNTNKIIAIKEASGDFSFSQDLIKNLPKSIQVISGDDSLSVPMLLSGAVGSISVIANAFPKQISQMIAYCNSSEIERAYKIHFKLLDLISALFEEGNPTGIKELMFQLSFCSNQVRLPLTVASGKLSKRISKIIKFLV
jgi:4-hydroxy-tetrahydrodipicolinate synthase